MSKRQVEETGRLNLLIVNVFNNLQHNEQKP